MLSLGGAPDLIEVFSGREHLLPKEGIPILFWAQFQFQYAAQLGRYAGSPMVASETLKNDQFVPQEMAWAPVHPGQLIRRLALGTKALTHSTSVEAWTPVRTYCEAYCPTEVAACTATGAGLEIGLFQLRSPLESVLPKERYWTSPRITGDLARITYDTRKYDEHVFGDLGRCFVRSMQVTQAEHGASKAR